MAKKSKAQMAKDIVAQAEAAGAEAAANLVMAEKEKEVAAFDAAMGEVKTKPPEKVAEAPIVEKVEAPVPIIEKPEAPKAGTAAAQIAEITTKAGEPTSKMDAVRLILADDPEISPDDGIDMLKVRFGIEMNKPTFSSYKSQIKAKAKGGEDGAVRPKAASSGWAAAPVRTGPTLADLRSVKAMMVNRAQYLDLSVNDLLETIKTIEAMADQVGGLANLRECLEALAEFSA